jgi:radical SAM superfamily enzyme YgiQ (UPF0313 family)
MRRVLLSSVFGPYAQDDEFGSRSINPMELYHNQVTRAQGAYSLRMFHRSWGILMIQHNIKAPCTVLDFPRLEDFRRELKAHRYDVVGISSIIVNVGKVKEMCRIVRELSPHSTVIVGGHVTAIPEIESMVDADHFVRGEGVAWMREFLGEDPGAPIEHPPIISGYGRRALGLSISGSMRSQAATVIPSVGCPMGCNFCTTSAFFGGKGKFKNFFESGRELYDIMAGLEQRLGVSSFFVMDENFLLQKPRAMELLRHMKQGNKPWQLYVFSSANAIRKYTMQELVELGISWVWMGLEAPNSSYLKLKDTDTLQLTREMRGHGIKLLGSTIVGLEHHTPENISDEIAHAVRHDTDFHQFMLYTPVPGTPLYGEMKEQGRIVDVDLADIHGQWKFNFQHAAISREQSKEMLDAAFQRDYEVNGPSLYRICRTTFEGWRRYKNHPDSRIRARFEREIQSLKTVYTGMLWAMSRHLRAANADVALRVEQLRQEIHREFGVASRLAASVLGPLILWSSRREEKRLARGFRYEPSVIVERRNWA